MFACSGTQALFVGQQNLLGNCVRGPISSRPEVEKKIIYYIYIYIKPPYLNCDPSLPKFTIDLHNTATLIDMSHQYQARSQDQTINFFYAPFFSLLLKSYSFPSDTLILTKFLLPLISHHRFTKHSSRYIHISNRL